MKRSFYKSKRLSRIFSGFLCVCFLTGFSFFIGYKTEAGNDHLKAQKNNYGLKSFSSRRADFPAVNIGERVSPWLRLQQGKPLDTTFYGNDAAISALRGNLAETTSQVSADFNSDGYADLVSGFRSALGGGLIALHKADQEAFQPQDERVLADLRRGVFPAAFEKDALILDVPAAPDFIFAGKFTENSSLDLVFAARGGSSVYLMSSDGSSGFGPAREIALGGEITAMDSDGIAASKTFSGLVIAFKNGKSSTVSVFDGSAELVKTAPRKFQIEGDVNSLILANPEGEISEKDVFGLADGEIFTMRRIGSSNVSINKIRLPFRTVDFAVGEFIRDREAKAEIAVLSEDGSISYLTRGTLDTRPFTTEEIVELRKQNGRGREIPAGKTTTNDLSNDWSVAETHQLGIYSPGENTKRVLQKARITGSETEDLLVMHSTGKRLQILFKEPNTEKNRTSFTGETKFQNIDLAENPSAVLPMRLNVLGQQGFVVFDKGNPEPIPVMTAPNAIFTVSKTPDTNDGACNADCSLREAVIAANGAAGPDMITFALNGTHQLTIAGINEENAATGDLDVRDAVTIVGNGAANTVIQAGSDMTNGIDKVFSINPTFIVPFATSFTGFTVRFGRNQSSFDSGIGFGGGFDWEGSGTGTLSVSGLTVTSNSTLDGDGGGIAATSTPGSSFVSFTNSTISNNDPDRVGAGASPVGGGMFTGTQLTYRLTNTVVTNNNVVESFMQGQGGGLYAFGPASSAGKSFLTGSTVTSNTAPSDGGGIYTLQPIDINPTATISNNASGRSGGGLFVNHSNGTTALSKVTMVGNSAANAGGALYLGSSTAANVLNMSFSRIVGNTSGLFSGLAVEGGTAIVENNWWGCNTGPGAAPCDTAGNIGVGSVDFNPWLQLRLTAAPNTTPVVGEPRSLTASFLLNSAGGAVAAGNLDVLIGQTVTWSASGGTISSAQATIQASGTATATFAATSASPPAGTATAQVDSGPATVSFTVGKANTTTTITAESADPTAPDEVFTVFYTVTVNSPGAGTPTGSVTVSDGANSCTGTVAAGQCSLFLNIVGVRTLTADYASDANFNGSVSPGEPHTVLPITAASVTISGRVQTPAGRGIANARVIFGSLNGQLMTAVTNGFGYYYFEGIPAGETYSFTVRHKQHQFAPQVVTVLEDVQGLNFTALE